jgi:hypothetical protein
MSIIRKEHSGLCFAALKVLLPHQQSTKGGSVREAVELTIAD